MMRKITAAFIFWICFSFAWSQTDLARLETLDQYIENARQQWNVPGLAISVVKDGQVVFSKGYGIRELGKKDKVTAQTLFGIASTTKAMTAACMGMLVDEGKLTWDDRVIDHLPEFQLSDPFISREVRIRDLFTHNAGLGNADFLWVDSDLTSKQIVARLRHAPIAYSFRAGYTYQNIMYLVAGEVIEKVSGMPWEEFIRQRIFQPLGMTRSYPMLKFAQQQGNLSIPHHFINETITPIPNMSADAIGPAGSVWSCADDMAKWMQFVLDSAKVNGQRLLKAETYSEWLRPQILISPSSFYPTVRLTQPNWTTYALGWFQHDYQNRMVSFHTGSLGGTVAIIGLIPEEKLGVYIFGNLDHAEVRHALMYKVFDLFGPGNASRDWSREVLQLYKNIEDRAKANQKKQDDQRVIGTRNSLPLEEYAGTYSDPFYGNAVVILEGEQMKVKLSSQLSLSLEHWHFNTFKGRWDGRPWRDPTWVSFTIDRNGKADELSVGSMKFRRS